MEYYEAEVISGNAFDLLPCHIIYCIMECTVYPAVFPGREQEGRGSTRISQQSIYIARRDDYEAKKKLDKDPVFVIRKLAGSCCERQTVTLEIWESGWWSTQLLFGSIFNDPKLSFFLLKNCMPPLTSLERRRLLRDSHHFPNYRPFPLEKLLLFKKCHRPLTRLLAFLPLASTLNFLQGKFMATRL